MKKNTVILLFLLSATLALAQKKEKIKGSKTVTVEYRETDPFDALELDDNLEVYLEKGEKNEVKIEADDNLHDIILFDLRDRTLRIYTSKEAISYNKLIVKITYTNDLNLITSKNESTINAIQVIQLADISFKTFDYSKLYLNVNSGSFLLQANDKSKIELNLKSESAIIELSENSQLKALLTTSDLKCDLYQKAKANIEGEVINAKLRLDNNSILTGSKLSVKNTEVITESYSVCSVLAETTVIIDAIDKSEIQLFGLPKIEIRNFLDDAKLFKKSK